MEIFINDFFFNYCSNFIIFCNNYRMNLANDVKLIHIIFYKKLRTQNFKIPLDFKSIFNHK